MPSTLIPQLLEAWREGERLLDALPPLDPDHETVARVVLTLRELYAGLSERRDQSDVQLDKARATLSNAADVLARARARLPPHSPPSMMPGG